MRTVIEAVGRDVLWHVAQNKDKDTNNIRITLKYSPLMRLVVLLFFLFGMLIGIMFLMAEGSSFFLKFFGISILVYSILMFCDVLLFVEMKIYDSKINKIWLIGTYSLEVKDAKVNKFSYKGVTRGYIRFYSKSNYFISFMMTIHLLALEDYELQFEKLKATLKKIQLLKGDEHEWYS